MAETAAELVRQATEQISTLARDELRLARAEMAEKGKRAGRGVGLFGGAAVTLRYAIGALLIPTHTIDSVRSDIDEVKTRFEERNGTASKERSWR